MRIEKITYPSPLVGVKHTTLDTKSRISIPSQWTEHFPPRSQIRALYAKNHILLLGEQAQEVPVEYQNIIQDYLSIDASGRMLIDSALRKIYTFSDSCWLIGKWDYIELHPSDEYFHERLNHSDVLITEYTKKYQHILRH